MKLQTRWAAALLALLLAVSAAAPAGAAQSDRSASDALDRAAAYIYSTVQAPQVGTTGGEWAVLGLARSGCAVPEQYYLDYYAAVETYVEACRGRLHDRKYTEYARVITALSALGKDARDVAGYDLTQPLGDYDKTVWQGLNGPVWALIALDSAGYPMPGNPQAQTQATRQMYVDCILSRQLDNGGWSLTGGTARDSRGGAADADLTGMALQALAKYRDQPEAAQAVERALAYLSAVQDDAGGFSGQGADNVESIVQAIVALTELGIPLDDPRFVKHDHTLLDALLAYQQPDGSFRHSSGGSDSNLMSSEQGLYALAAARRAAEGKPSLYRMEDALTLTASARPEPSQGTGLSGKHPDVTPVPVSAPDKTFSDLSGNPARTAVEALAARGIINGKPDGGFDPDGCMTRAEFAAIVVRALGLEPRPSAVFPDVTPSDWYAGYAGAASAYGIVTGSESGAFLPEHTITRQEAAVMAARAAKLCGLETALSASETRDTLAQFSDYIQSAGWAREALAVCCRQGILDQSDLNIRPLDPVTRAEVAQMLFQLLTRAQLL